MNWSINNVFTEQITAGQLADIQFKLCVQYDNNIKFPLVIALLSMMVRMLIIYKIDKIKYPKLYRLGETGTDILTAICICTSLIWMSVI